MSKLLIGLVTLLVIAGGGVFLLLENPDRFKSQITRAAEAGTGYDMEIKGKLSWRYWPPIAINVEDVAISTPGNDTFATFDTMAIDVDLLPVLMRQPVVDINEVSLTGGRITLEINKDGEENWALKDVSAPDPQGTGGDDSTALQASIQRFSIEDLSLAYVDRRNDTDIELKVHRLVSSALASDRPFDISLVTTAKDRGKQLAADITATGQLLYKSETGNINFNELITTVVATVDGHTYPETRFSSSGEWRQEDQRLVLNDNAISTSAIAMTARGVVSLATAEPRFDGAVTLDIADPGRVGRDFDIELPVSFLQLKSDLTATPSVLQLLTLEGRFDESALTGTGILDISDDFFLKSELRIDRLDTSKYLETGDTASTTGAGTTTASELIPFQALRDRKMAVILRIGELLYNGSVFSASKAEFNNTGWRLDINFNTEVHGGKLLVNTTSMLKKDGESTLWLSMDELDLTSLADFDGITGKLSGNARLSFIGNMTSDLAETLEGKTTFHVVDGTLNVRPIKELAAMIDRLRGKQSPVSKWPDIMPFKRMVGQHVFAGGTRDGQLITAELENLKLMAVGGFDLANERLAYDISTMFEEPRNGQFDVGSDLIGVRWPMTCEGSFSETPADLCFGKDGAISDLVTDLAKQEVERHGNEKLKEVLGDKVPKEYRDLTDKLFKNLFQ